MWIKLDYTWINRKITLGLKVKKIWIKPGNRHSGYHNNSEVLFLGPSGLHVWMIMPNKTSLLLLLLGQSSIGPMCFYRTSVTEKVHV